MIPLSPKLPPPPHLHHQRAAQLLFGRPATFLTSFPGRWRCSWQQPAAISEPTLPESKSFSFSGCVGKIVCFNCYNYDHIFFS